MIRGSYFWKINNENIGAIDVKLDELKIEGIR